MATDLFDKMTSCFRLPPEIDTQKIRKYYKAPYNSMLHKKFEPFFQPNLNETILPKDRSYLTYEILSRTSYSTLSHEGTTNFLKHNDQEIGIRKLLRNKTFTAAYPLHGNYNKKEDDNLKQVPFQSYTNRQLLWEYWAHPKRLFTYQPLHIIRNYFGAKLGFYFAWLGFYTTWLIFPSILGVLTVIYGALTVNYDAPTSDICDENRVGNYSMCPLCNNANYCDKWVLRDNCFYAKFNYLIDNPVTILFSATMSIWGVLFIKSWRRQQSTLQFQWDTIEIIKTNESVRPETEERAQFKRKNKLTGLEEPYIPFKTKLTQYLASISVIIFMISLVIAFLIGIIVYRNLMRSELWNTFAGSFVGPITSATAALINLVIILILGKIYSYLAVKLTDVEYHKTDAKYEDSLTIKMFLFEFANYYGSIFYIAFFKGKNYATSTAYLKEQVGQMGAFLEVCIQLAIIMIGKQLFVQIREVVYHRIWGYIVRRKFIKKIKSDKNKPLPPWEENYALKDWNQLTLFNEYLKMMIQFGFVILFIVYFPLGPLFAFLNNIVEIKIDSYKFLIQLKRPLPRKAQDIG
jgi:hypothetical protein